MNNPETQSHSFSTYIFKKKNIKIRFFTEMQLFQVLILICFSSNGFTASLADEIPFCDLIKGEQTILECSRFTSFNQLDFSNLTFRID